MPTSFDAIVIGTGRSGVPLALKLAKAGQKVAVDRKRPFRRDLPLDTGCIPTKAMVASARTAHVARRAQEKFGVLVPAPIQVKT